MPLPRRIRTMMIPPYDKAHSNKLHNNFRSIQYNACHALTGTPEEKGTSKENLYQELRLESLRQKRWYRKLCTFYKIFKNQGPCYLSTLIPAKTFTYTPSTVANLLLLGMETLFFQKFLPPIYQ